LRIQTLYTEPTGFESAEYSIQLQLLNTTNGAPDTLFRLSPQMRKNFLL
jgi:hypothetical protein